MHINMETVVEVKIYIAIYIKTRQDTFHFLEFCIIYEALIIIVRREMDK